jgi:hypothetical protein
MVAKERREGIHGLSDTRDPSPFFKFLFVFSKNLTPTADVWG